MKNIIPRFFPLLLLLMSIAAYSQNAGDDAKPGKAIRADKLYNKFYYSQAIDLYESLAKKDPTKAEYMIKLANCYRATQNYEKAAEWYGKVVGLSASESAPVNRFYYAQMLMSIEDYKNASFWFGEYAKATKNNKFGLAMQRGAENIEQLKELESAYELTRLPINSPEYDFGAVPYLDGIIFASDREYIGPVKKTYGWTDNYFLQLWYCEKKGDSTDFSRWGKPELLDGNVNSDYHEGPLVLSADHQTMIFSRNNFNPADGERESNDGIVKLNMYTAMWDGKQWKEQTPFAYNDNNYSTGHPALSSDGELLIFSSHGMPRTDTVGGTDLFYCNMVDGDWSEPKSLGKDINTPGNEMFPVLHTDGMLYFASDGHPGFGGLDIFSSVWDEKNKKWGNVRNLGQPVNSNHDDFGLVLSKDKSYGYLTTNRDSEFDDIWAVKRMELTLNVLVVNKLTGEPIEGAKVKLGCDDGMDEQKISDVVGTAMWDINPGLECEVNASRSGYLPGSSSVSTKGYPSSGEIDVVIELMPFDGIVMEGTVVNKRSPSTVIPDATINLLDKCADIDQPNTSGDDGKFYYYVARDCDFVVTAMKRNYIPDEKNATTDGMSSGDTLRITLMLDELVQDQTYVLENIFYDFDKWFLRPESKVELNKLHSLLQQYPNMVIEIGSHTDSRADDNYNIELSAKRAQSCVDYLIGEKKLNPMRISAKGYGENRMIVDCVKEGVDGCIDSKEQDCPCHQNNRRTEFKIIKF